jgi:hypothetical protein
MGLNDTRRPMWAGSAGVWPQEGHADTYGDAGVYNTDVHTNNFGPKVALTSIHWESVPESRFPLEWDRCANEVTPTSRDGTNILSNVITK